MSLATFYEDNIRDAEGNIAFYKKFAIGFILVGATVFTLAVTAYVNGSGVAAQLIGLFGPVIGAFAALPYREIHSTRRTINIFRNLRDYSKEIEDKPVEEQERLLKQRLDVLKI